MPYEHTDILHGNWLIGRSNDVYSQFGEDGLIEASLEYFGRANDWCFEVGANDGIFFSNTKVLRDNGWRSVLIESDDKHYEKLATIASDKVKTVHEKVTIDSMDRILADAGCPRDMDLGVIDVDGQDYWIWSGMQLYRPRLMLVEYARYDGIPEPDFVPSIGGDGQASYRPMIELGKDKGYLALARTYVNILFCLTELC